MDNVLIMYSPSKIMETEDVKFKVVPSKTKKGCLNCRKTLYFNQYRIIYNLKLLLS